MRPDDLKPRELEILTLMADHQTNAEIASALFLGVETIRTYAKQIYRKLDVANRREATRKAKQLGLIGGTIPHRRVKLPQKLTPFIGREHQLEDILRLLQTNRLVTLTGPGGIGKTRLAIRVAEKMLGQFKDGIYFVDLAPLDNEGDVIKVVAATLGITETKPELLLDLIKKVIDTQSIFLVIDNFEHVIDSALLVSELLQATQNLKILVTSREVLRLSGEQEYPIPPFNLQSPKKNTHSEAVILFMNRAQSVRPNFVLNADNQVDIIEICQQVEGLPLAIELAAAQCRWFSPQVLLKSLKGKLLYLSSGLRDVPLRHQTLYNTIAWSYDLLDEDEKRLFIRLSVFRDGCSLEAIEATCFQGMSIKVMDGLIALMDKSLIQQMEDEQGEPRFYILDVIQNFALEQLELENQVSMMRHQHARHFMELVEQAAPELRLANQEWWFGRLEIERSNLQTAMTWTLSGEAIDIGARIVASLRDYWWYQGLAGESWEWIEPALNYRHQLPDEVKANLLLTAGNLAYFRGDVESCRRYGSEALAVYQALGDEQGIAWSSNFPAIDVANSLEERIQTNRHTLALMRAIGDLPGQTNMLNILGLLLTEANDFENAIIAFEECITITRRIGEKRREAIAIGCLAEIALREKHYTLAIDLFKDSFQLGQDLAFPFHLHDLFWMCIVLFTELDQFNVAITLYGAAKSRERKTGQSIFPFQAEYLTKIMEDILAKRSESRVYQANYDMGYDMSLQEAVQFALDGLGEIEI